MAGITISSSSILAAISACAKKVDKPLGIALVGMGYYASNKLAPALQETQLCKLAGFVTGTPDKEDKYGKQFNIPKSHIYNYENFDSLKDNPDIDIVYIALPNSMHAEFTIRAAKAGKHVICEKPMAISVVEAEQMIQACKDANRKLAIGYRLQYEPHNREMMRLGQNEIYGPVNFIETANAFYGVGWDNWRFDKSLSGGGPLMDMGIYCIQGVRYTLGKEPISITAQQFSKYPDFFKTVEETLTWQMLFEDGTAANCMTSYAARSGFVTAHAKEGKFGLEPAYGYGPLKGFVKDEAMPFEHTNHQAVQMDAFAENIINDSPIIASGAEGLQDMRIIEAIYKAMESREEVKIQN